MRITRKQWSVVSGQWSESADSPLATDNWPLATVLRNHKRLVEDNVEGGAAPDLEVFATGGEH